jgi:hypothetical protein
MIGYWKKTPAYEKILNDPNTTSDDKDQIMDIMCVEEDVN